MSAIRRKITSPKATIREIIRAIIDRASQNDNTSLVLFDDGALNAAVTAHCGAEAVANSALDTLIVVNYEDTSKAQRLHEMIDALKPKLVTVLKPEGRIEERCQNYSLSIVSDNENALILSSSDLTDYFVGTGERNFSAHHALEPLLKSEVERIAKEIIDFNNSTLTKELADPRNTCIDNRLAAQDSPHNTDFALCAVLAAKETECELLLGSYKEHPISEWFQRTRYTRSISNLDYNKLRDRFLDICTDPSVEI